MKRLSKLFCTLILGVTALAGASCRERGVQPPEPFKDFKNVNFKLTDRYASDKVFKSLKDKMTNYKDVLNVSSSDEYHKLLVDIELDKVI